MRLSQSHYGVLLCILVCILLPMVGCAQADGLVVSQLTVSRPAIVNRYATVNCTVENQGKKDIVLKSVVVNIASSDGNAKPFGIFAFTNPTLPAVLHAGEKYSFREFQRMLSPGSYNCTVTAVTNGAPSPVSGLDGNPASVVLRAVTPDEVRSVDYKIADPSQRHVYRSGDTIHITVTSICSGGPSLVSQVSSVNITTPSKPWTITDQPAAQLLLTNSTATDKKSFDIDFYHVPDTQKFADVTVQFQHPVELASIRLNGNIPNGQYGVKTCVATITKPDGATVSLPVQLTTTGGSWSVLSTASHSSPAASLQLRLDVPYKVEMESLSLVGNATIGQTLDQADDITAEWRDVTGKPVSAPESLTPFQENAVSSPANLAPGYYGLMLTSKVAGQDDARHEYGFAVLPPDQADASNLAKKDPRFDFTHGDMDDPNIGMSWNKSMSTSSTGVGDGIAWQQAVADQKAHGVSQLPLVGDSNWKSDSTKPVSQDQLTRLRTEMAGYFKAVPDISYWELGLEETLGYRGHRDTWTYFWPNLEAKAKAVRQAANDAGIKENLIFQIAESDSRDAEEFLKSPASKQFDVLSLHPYWWPDFPTPESWMPQYVTTIRGYMDKYDTHMPIWFTEIGAPVESDPGQFIGYAGNPGVFDKVPTRHDHAIYTVKCHLIAWQNNVPKVFWYDYKDGSPNSESAEANFGMVDYWGFPKPTYVAYVTMVDQLRECPQKSHGVVDGNVQFSRFAGADKNVVVTWTYPAATKDVSLKSLGIVPANVVSVCDIFGKPLKLSGTVVTIGDSPIYIAIRH